MLLTLRIPWIMVDLESSRWRPVMVPSGSYPVERIANPRNEHGTPWLRITGTQVGINERLALDMANVHFGDFRLEVTANDELPEAERTSVQD